MNKKDIKCTFGSDSVSFSNTRMQIYTYTYTKREKENERNEYPYIRQGADAMTGLGSTANTQEQILQKNDLKRKKKNSSVKSMSRRQKNASLQQEEKRYTAVREKAEPFIFRNPRRPWYAIRAKKYVVTRHTLGGKLAPLAPLSAFALG